MLQYTRESVISTHPNAGQTKIIIDKCGAFLFMPTSVFERNVFIPKSPPKYELLLFGVTLDGSKVCVVVRGIKPSFVIRATPKEAEALKREINGKRITINTGYGDNEKFIRFDYRHLRGKSFESYQEHESDFMEIICDSTTARKDLISYFTKRGILTYQDDTNHINKVCREYPLTLAGWNLIRNYKISYTETNCQYAIETTFNNITDIDLLRDVAGGKYPDYDTYTEECRRAAFPDQPTTWLPPKRSEHLIQNWDPDEVASFVKAIASKKEQLSQDPTLVMTWDIETYGEETGGEPPLPEHDKHIMFMICLTVHYHYDNTPLLKLCITHAPIEKKGRYEVIETASEKDTIIAFCDVFKAISPEYLVGFNDSDYDAKWLVERSYKYGLMQRISESFNAVPRPYGNTDKAILKDMYKVVEIKLEADMKITTKPLQGIGFISVDARTEYRKIYKKADKSSLNFYLQENGLELKVDMPYQRMFEIYATGDAENMEEVGHYCWWDAYCCQALLNKRHIIPAKRALAKMAMVSTRDSFYRADGSKVLNCLMYEYTRRRIYCSNKNFESEDNEKYPGAYVVPPHKGLDTDFPVADLDFSSLYPSLIMTYNLSPEYLLMTRSDRDAAEKAGHTIHEIDFTYAESGERVNAWTIRHDNKPEKMGVYGYILKELFDKRVLIKAELALCKDAVENLEFLLDGKITVADICRDEKPNEIVDDILQIDSDRRSAITEVTDHLRESIESVITKTKYRSALVDLSQLALKVLMNTFYGKTGDKTSSFYRVPIAGGITSAGKKNLKFVRKIVEAEGCYVKYGDTDSLYLQFDPKIYNDAMQEYAEADKRDPSKARDNKLAYWTRLVEIAFIEIERLKKLVNDALIADNGTKFLKMAYEQVLFPSCFLGKKKYFGIPHEKKIDFFPKKPFIRGLEMVKRGNTKLLCLIGDRIMRDALSIDNKLPIEEIVIKHFKSIFTEQWDISYFEASKTYKPKKKNVSVLTFVDRMKAKAAQEEELRKQGKYLVDDREEGAPEPERLYVVPNGGDKIKIVVCQTDDWYHLNGNKKDPSVGDRFEYVDVYKRLANTDNPLKIDLKYYAEGAIIGMCARFITQLFEVKARIEDEVEYKEADKKSFEAAKKYLMGIVKEHCAISYSKETAAKYKAAYKNAKAVIGNRYPHIDMSVLSSLTALSKFNQTVMEKEIHGMVTKADIKGIDRIIDRYIRRCGGSIEEVNKYFGNGKPAQTFVRDENAFIDREVKRLIVAIAENVNKIKQVDEQYSRELEDAVMSYRKDIAVTPTTHDTETINPHLETVEEITKDYQKIVKYLRVKIFREIIRKEIHSRLVNNDAVHDVDKSILKEKHSIVIPGLF